MWAEGYKAQRAAAKATEDGLSVSPVKSLGDRWGPPATGRHLAPTAVRDRGGGYDWLPR